MTSPSWWQNAICYQIYPRSFADSNGDGIGDLPGIISKLDYLQSLGVTAIWISPFFPSPNFDWGYDVADYTDVDPDYGTLADAERLIAEAHRRGIRVILDLVLNHTSDQHPWFQEALSSTKSPYRDWFVWRNRPNDWESLFGGSAWTKDEQSGDYYYHFFFPEQPDLNWRNPAVKQAMFDAVRFWLDRGVDGFRLDAISCVYETEDFPDCGIDTPLESLFIDLRQGMFEGGGWEAFHNKLRHQMDHPEVHQLMRELRQLVDGYGDRILLGETGEVAFYGNGHDELHSVFNFSIIGDLDASTLRQTLTERLAALPDGAWESNTVGNHDRSRSWTFYADGKQDKARSQMALAMVMFLPGTPVFYYGEEIGMQDGHPPAIDEFKDGLGTWFYHAMRRQGRPHEEAFKVAADFFCRDRCRTPMQWSDDANAGFSPAGVETWLPVNADGASVAAQEDDPDGMLTFFKEIARLRQSKAALRVGQISLVPDSGSVLLFWREIDDQRCLVALNMSAEPAETRIEQAGLVQLYSNATVGNGVMPDGRLTLAPYEIWVGEG